MDESSMLLLFLSMAAPPLEIFVSESAIVDDLRWSELFCRLFNCEFRLLGFK